MKGQQPSTDPCPQHPPPHPHPEPDRYRTFPGRAQNAGGGRSKPNSSSTKRPTPPARGPPSSGDHAMLPQRAGLRTGGLAGKCAAPGLAGTAAALCGCALQGTRPSPAHPLSHHSTQAQPGRASSPSILPIALEMPKGQSRKLEPAMAVAMAVGGQLPGQQTLLSLSRQARKIDSVEWNGESGPHLSLPGRRYMTCSLDKQLLATVGEDRYIDLR